MNDLTCCFLGCSNHPEFHCSCSTSISICVDHVSDHLKPNPFAHKIDSIYDQINSSTKSSLLDFLSQEKHQFSEIKSNLLSYYSLNLSKAQSSIQDRLESIDREIHKIDKLQEIATSTTKIRKTEGDELIKVLKRDKKDAINKYGSLISDKSVYQDLYKFIYVNDADAEKIISEIVEKKVEKYLIERNVGIRRVKCWVDGCPSKDLFLINPYNKTLINHMTDNLWVQRES